MALRYYVLIFDETVAETFIRNQFWKKLKINTPMARPSNMMQISRIF